MNSLHELRKELASAEAAPYLFGGLGLLLVGAGFMVFRHQGLVLR